MPLLQLNKFVSMDEIPPDTHLRVVSMPDRKCVFSDKVTEVFELSVPIGRYNYSMTFPRGKTRNVFRDQGSVLIGLTEEQYEALSELETVRAKKTPMTTEGYQYMCGWDGCNYKTPSKVDMIKHECKHNGVSFEELLDNPLAAVTKMVKKQNDATISTEKGALKANAIENQILAQKAQQKGAKGGPTKGAGA